MIQTVGQIINEEGGGFLKMWRTFVDPATRMWQDHRHGNFEIATVISGTGRYCTGAGILPIEAGDVFVFAGNEPHWILEIGSEGLEIINLHFDHPCFLAGCCISKRYPNLYFSHSPTFCNRIPANHSQRLRQLTGTICEELEHKQAEFESFVYANLDMLFCDLVRHHAYYCPDDGTHTAMQRIQNSLIYIDLHYTEDISLEQIAAQSNLSPQYFSRLFSACFHIKLWDHVLSKRIDAAKRLLLVGKEMTVLDVALQCGFHNTANFNRVFLRFTGITPSEYRSGKAIH
jgi:AraC-like DNA-binding protein